MDHAAHGQASLRVALAGSDGPAGLANPGAPGGLAVAVNRESVGSIHVISTNALRYNFNKGVWREYTLAFDATLLKAGENEIHLTVPAGELTSGVVYDYLRLELDENHQPAGPPAATAN
jgi:rhamnogalacturonan endolyase